ncbi:MAG TPA: sulfotransferase [Oleiagrimonas sp.]|nr:sulfotransferase [Oleiagrimonas sp.]
MHESLRPTDHRVERMRRRVQVYLQSSMWAAAQISLEGLLRSAPDDVDARMMQCKLLLHTGQLQAATSALLAMTRNPPETAPALLELARLLVAVGEKVEARDCLDQKALLRTTSRSVMVGVAHVRFGLGEPEAALTWMDRPMAQDGANKEDYQFRALLLQFVGCIDEAEAVLDACLRQWPTFGSAALTRSRLRRQSAENQHVDFLFEQASRAQPYSLESAVSHYALFKELDDLERYDEAWQALQQANAIMHTRNPYDEAGDARLQDAVMHYVDADICQREPEWRPEGPLPIFIVGMPRSGTTLLERMLGNHSQVTPAGELDDFLSQWCWLENIGMPNTEAFVRALSRTKDLDFRKLGERYLRQTAWRARGRARFIDKMPGNFQNVGLIHRALPGACILNLVREPMAVCFSNFKAMFGDQSPHCYDQRLLAGYYHAHERLRRHWHRVAPGAMLDVSYETLVQSPEDTMRQVLEFCGLGFEVDCLHPTRNKTSVSTPSSAQVREPIHVRGLDEWKRYADHLVIMQRGLDAGGRQES